MTSKVSGQMQLPRFKAGSKSPSPWSAKDMNQLVDVLNAFLKLKIVRGEADKVFIADGNVIIQLREIAPSAGTSSGGGGGSGCPI